MGHLEHDPFTRDAHTRVRAYIAAHREITLDGVAQPGQGATNRVIFGRRGDDLVVFKVFCEAERKARSLFALRHWACTGLVPRLLDDIDQITILKTHVPGTYLLTALEVEGEQAWPTTCRATGAAVAALGAVQLNDADRAGFETRFYGDLGSLEAYADRILTLGRSIVTCDLDFTDAFWSTNLDFLEGQLPALLAQPRCLYHQDVSNLSVQDGTFRGFFDLEMCRVGCAAMQLGAAVRTFLPQPGGWKPFLEGYESVTGRRLTGTERRCVAAAASLLDWREITRYMSYDGSPGSGYAWASPADSTVYREKVEAVRELLSTDQ